LTPSSGFLKPSRWLVVAAALVALTSASLMAQSGSFTRREFHPYATGPMAWSFLIVTMVMGAPFGMLGGAWVRRWSKPADAWVWSRTGMGADMLLGGVWWSLSAVMPSWDFPLTFLRSLLGAFLIAAVYECGVALVRSLFSR
jgi:hypothetical protein